MQQARTFVPFDQPVASNRQIQQAIRGAAVAGKASCVDFESERTRAFLPKIFESFSVYWKGDRRDETNSDSEITQSEEQC